MERIVVIDERDPLSTSVRERRRRRTDNARVRVEPRDTNPRIAGDVMQRSEGLRARRRVVHRRQFPCRIPL